MHRVREEYITDFESIEWDLQDLIRRGIPKQFPWQNLRKRRLMKVVRRKVASIKDRFHHQYGDEPFDLGSMWIFVSASDLGIRLEEKGGPFYVGISYDLRRSADRHKYIAIYSAQDVRFLVAPNFNKASRLPPVIGAFVAREVGNDRSLNIVDRHTAIN